MYRMKVLQHVCSTYFILCSHWFSVLKVAVGIIWFVLLSMVQSGLDSSELQRFNSQHDQFDKLYIIID